MLFLQCLLECLLDIPSNLLAPALQKMCKPYAGDPTAPSIKMSCLKEGELLHIAPGCRANETEGIPDHKESAAVLAI